MTLRLHNTLTRKLEEFRPLRPGHVGMYVCGPTVYGRAHLGNFRPVVLFDVLYRLLKRSYAVTYVRNITDIDDKIIKASHDLKKPVDVLTEETIRFFQEDTRALLALQPTVEPRATTHIAEMIDFIKALLDKGIAYEAQHHVLFHVPGLPRYGELSNMRREEMMAGARVEVAPYKKDPADFVLWKPSDETQPGWDSPWGRGRPGWHIECSAMSLKHLGVTFDIHAGGQDLIFPHHENEIAQSIAVHGHGTFARYWLHNGVLTINGEKMSKSLGNFIVLSELLQKARGETIRFALLSTHYRQPLDLTDETLPRARAALNRLYGALEGITESISHRPVQSSVLSLSSLDPSRRDEEREDLDRVDMDVDTGPEDEGMDSDAERQTDPEVIAALEDDLNTPLAIARLHALASEIYKLSPGESERRVLQHRLRASATILGLLQSDPQEWLQGQESSFQGLSPREVQDQELSPQEIEEWIGRRSVARQSKDFAASDHIRDMLAARGVILLDSPSGTTWRRV